MNNKLLENIFQILNKFRDPITNKTLDRSNKNIEILLKEGNVNIVIKIEPQHEKKYQYLINDLKKDIQELDDIISTNIVLTSEKSNKEAENNNQNRSFKVNSKNIIAIASGKGGVGKSTFAVNYAVALEKLGYKTGILDADIYGPSVPRMMGITDRPKANENKKLIPLENHGVKCMSIGFLIGVDTPTIWRGPMVMKALEQMFNGVEWGQLDYLIIDMPPGTGDAQLTLAQNSKLSGSIIISTPQDVALIDARKGINMFNKVGIPVLGIVENMSYFICSNCNERHEIFSNGGAKKEAEKSKTNFLGELPLDKDLRIYSDKGSPVCISDPESNLAKLYLEIAEKIHQNLE